MLWLYFLNKFLPLGTMTFIILLDTNIALTHILKTQNPSLLTWLWHLRKHNNVAQFAIALLLCYEHNVHKKGQSMWETSCNLLKGLILILEKEIPLLSSSAVLMDAAILKKIVSISMELCCSCSIISYVTLLFHFWGDKQLHHIFKPVFFTYQ